MKLKIIILLICVMMLAACGDSPGLKSLKQKMPAGYDADVMRIISSDTSKDITPWLKENAQKYDAVYMFPLVLRLIKEKAPLEETIFWLTAAKFRAAMYMSVCKYQQSDEGALFSAFSVETSEAVGEAFQNTPELAKYQADKAAQDKLLARLKEWVSKNFPSVPDNFCKKGYAFPEDQRQAEFEKFKAKIFSGKSGGQDNSSDGGVSGIYSEINVLLEDLSNSQLRFFYANNKYAKDFSFLDIVAQDSAGNAVSGSVYMHDNNIRFRIFDNPNGWVLSAESIIPKYRSILMANAKTSQWCCYAIDAGTCKLYNIPDLQDCTALGLIKSKK